MKYSSVIFLLFFFTLSCRLVNGQSLAELYDFALANNAQLKVLENEYLAALEVAPQVSQRPDPELSAGIFPFPVETRLGAQIARLSAMQMLLWPGVLDAKQDLALAKAKSKYESIAAQQLELQYSIQQAYYNLYKIQQSRNILRRNKALLEALEQTALANIAAGKGSGADVLKIQLKSTELESELAILENEKTKPQTNINQLLQRDLDTPVVIRDSFGFAQMPLDEDSLLKQISQNHPMLKMFALQQATAEQEIRLSHLSKKPSFGLGMDYIMVTKRTDAEPSQNGRDILQLRAAVNVPLNKKKYAAKEREEELKIIVLEQQKTEILSRFAASINNAFTDHAIAAQKITLYEKQREITQAAIRILEGNYSNEASRFDELLRLEMDLITYELKILNAVVDSHLAKAAVERYGF